ncbi:Enterobactin exporter EntS [Tsuneonella dongtanensis]|uniref:Enterobactin exporter EntS n=1 Tax=Tsuneonella dongtanensis TaxID=692370 RepID=A0A1B2AEC4_9SPHN|nr:MFS transporter [Tsuneonella dongtanensis]ANY20487.1 Enterobactin exporter EntS [Tsuneonella dongtanensis]
MSAVPHPLSIANFRAYFLSRLLGTIAISAQSIIIGWQVYSLARETMDIKHSALLLGIIGLVQFVPLFLLTPVVGLIADTYDRRWIVRWTTLLLTLNAAMLGYLTWTGNLSLPFLFVAAMFVGVARAFAGPAYSALAPNLVPRAVLPTAIAVSSMAWQVGTIAGPSVGGVLYAIHPDVAYASISAMLAASLLLIFLIKPVPQPAVQKDRRPIQRVVDGFRYVRDNRLVMATITLDLFVVLFAGATALLPVFARDILQVGPDGFGVLAAGMGIGATAASIWFSFFPMKSDVGVKMLAAVIVFALAIVTFGLSKLFWLSLIALVVAGAADMVSVYIRQSLIQLHTPDEMRGRVGAVSALTISASNELGETESGLLAAVIGPVAAVVAGGVAAIAITLYWARLFPELRLAKTFDPPPLSHPDKPQEALP